jgi:hypothetical protein
MSLSCSSSTKPLREDRGGGAALAAADAAARVPRLDDDVVGRLPEADDDELNDVSAEEVGGRAARPRR